MQQACLSPAPSLSTRACRACNAGNALLPLAVESVVQKLRLHGWGSIGLEDEHWHKVITWLWKRDILNINADVNSIPVECWLNREGHAEDFT